jgi:hypothetical protein
MGEKSPNTSPIKYQYLSILIMANSLSLLEIFGGSSAILLGVGGCIWKYCQGYEFSYHWGFFSKNIPTNTLDITWEKNEKSIEGGDNWENCGNQENFAKTIGEHAIDKKWEIKMKKGDRGVFVYKNIHMKPTDNNGHHFLRVKLRNAPTDADIKLSVKFYDGDWEGLSNHPEEAKPVILNCCNNVYTITVPSLLDTDDIKIEQIGINFGANKVDYDMVIEEAYYGKECNMCNVKIFGFHIATIVYSKIAVAA